MPFIKSTQLTAESVNIYYEDLGKGKPIVFIHGWPLSGSMWEYQVTELTKQGYRCITYDRRGFGKSDKPFSGYDYDTMAGDLKALLDELNIEDTALVGFSMGGGEVAKYFKHYGNAHISKVVLLSCVVPYMLKTNDNPDGVPREIFDEIIKGIKNDRPGFMENFAKDFFGVSMMKHPVSDAFLANNLTKVMEASPIATLECVHSFAYTDFREDVLKINVPTLVIHGDADKIVPIKATGEQSAKLIKDADFIIYPDAPHGLWYTEREQLNKDLASFI
ncbi:MAG: alpha/beta fold hydrolase [Bacteroidia bacterium]